MKPNPPPRRLSALTTYELTRYQRDLAHALSAIHGTGPSLLRGRAQMG